MGKRQQLEVDENLSEENFDEESKAARVGQVPSAKN